MKDKTIILRCDDGQEACVFHKYVFTTLGDTMYEISIEDSYVGGDYKGFFGRIKRAWNAFWARPVSYTSICRHDKESMQKFLQDCLDSMEEDEEDFETKYKPQRVSNEMIKEAFVLMREVNEREEE